MSEGFWERRAAKARGEQQPEPVQRSEGPWWRETTLPRVEQGSAPPSPQNGSEARDGHDYSKALHLKNEGNCPECGSGNYIQVTKASAWRCWNCGYVEGRSLADPNRPVGMSSDVPAQNTRQISSTRLLDGTGKDTGMTIRSEGNRGNISTANEASAYIGGV